MAVRIETDLLGSREVPQDAYWGIHTLRAIENYKISGRTVNDVPEMIRGMVMVKKAVAEANRQLRVMPDDMADAIMAACDEILVNGRCMDQFPIDVFQGGAGTSVNMNVNEVIANLALETLGYEKGRYDIINPNDDVNKSQSTNDAYPTGLRIAIMMALEPLREALRKLSDAFKDKGEEFKDVLSMGRTQLQDAVPITLGQEFNGFGHNLWEETLHIRRALPLIGEVNLGGTAIGTSLNAPPGFTPTATRTLALISGFPITYSPDLIEASYDTGAFLAAHSVLRRLAVKLSKICNDLRLLASGPRAGLNEINLPEMAAGSSIMPAKVNPVIPEVVNQVCFKVMGNDVTITVAAEAGQLELNVMEPVIAQALFESIYLLTNACDTLRTKCVEGITANDHIVRDYVFNSVGIVTYLNEIIGHANGDIVGRTAAETGRSVRDVVLEMGLMTEDEIDAVFTIDNFLQPVYHGRYYEVGEKGLPEKE